MPRTKQRKAAKRNSTGYEQYVRDFNRLVNLRIQKIEMDYKRLSEDFDRNMQCVLKRYPVEIQNMTLRELLTIDESPKKEKSVAQTPRVPKSSKKNSAKPTLKSTNSKRVTAASDDGYQSESVASQPSKTISGIRRLTRSSSQDHSKERSRSISQDRQSKASTTTNTQKKKVNRNILMTPSNRKPTNTFVITPKIKLNAAMNVLRKPKDGEMVFSTSGSPLLVSTTVNDKTANINVPLTNGNIVSLLPFHETSLTENLHLDDETRKQLKILQGHLAKVLD